jgi:hypothetical protein
MLARMMPDEDSAILFDTGDALQAPPSRNLLRAMFEPPFLAMTLALLVRPLLAGLYGVGRFGPARRPVRAIPFGKAALVENSAGLVRLAGREVRLGAAYADLVRDEAARAGAAPPHLQGEALEAYLDRRAAARRRDQPHAAQDAGGAARGDAGAAGDHRRADPPLPDPFFVLATQNPIEQEGTYPLPEAQLDRFLFKRSGASSPRTAPASARRSAPQGWGIERRRRGGAARAAIATVAALPMVAEVVDYVVDLVRATRSAPDLEPAPPRARRLAGRRRAGARGAGRARLRHPRRRQGARARRAAPPRDPVARRRDRGAAGRRRHRPPDRRGRGAALIYPTRTLVLLAAAARAGGAGGRRSPRRATGRPGWGCWPLLLALALVDALIGPSAARARARAARGRRR